MVWRYHWRSFPRSHPVQGTAEIRRPTALRLGTPRASNYGCLAPPLLSPSSLCLPWARHTHTQTQPTQAHPCIHTDARHRNTNAIRKHRCFRSPCSLILFVSPCRACVCIHACAHIGCVCECVYVFVCVAQKDADMKVTGEEVTSYHKWKHEASLV